MPTRFAGSSDSASLLPAQSRGATPKYAYQLRKSGPFPHVNRLAYEFDRPWAIDEVIGYLYATSLPLRRLLGNPRAAFEKEVTNTLHALEPNGQLVEPVTLEVLIGTKR